MPPRDKNIPISRALGRFFGHLWNAAAAPVDPGEEARKKTVSRSSEETPAEIDGRPVVLRRTVIEEIEFRDGPGPS